MSFLGKSLKHLMPVFFLFGHTLPVWAQDRVHFKKETLPHLHWFSYGLVTVVLLTLLLILKKYAKNQKKNQPYPVEVIPLQGKTKAYIISCQNQRFIIAENPQAIAIHPLPVTQEPSL